MKAKLTFLIIMLLSLFFTACEDKDDNGGNGNKKEGYEYVNGWILDSMTTYYLWNNHLPSKKSLNFNQDPYDFFDNILYSTEKGGEDRFSRMEGTHINIPKSSVSVGSAEATHDIGFHFVGAWYKQPRVALTITYVKKGSKAEQLGLKRGLAIIGVDGKYLYDSGSSLLGEGLYWYEALYQGKSSYKIDIYDPVSKKETNNVELQVTENYNENPILLDTVYTINSKKIAYIIYNSYEAGGEANLPYDVALTNILAAIENNKNIRNLIIDLRYNGGGLVRSAQFLASALVPRRSTSSIFEIKTYNPSFQQWVESNSKRKEAWMYDYFVDYVKTDEGTQLATIPKLGDQLDNLYFIVSGYTASASEMTINTLKPYFKDATKNIFLVGEKTVGKNVGSWAIYERDNKNNTYVLWPITFKSHNRDMESDYSTGFSPNTGLQANDFEMITTGMKELGDNEETMLKVALDHIVYGKYNTQKKSITENVLIKGKSSFDRIPSRMYLTRKQVDKLILE